MTHTGSWFLTVSLLSLEFSSQVILMTLPKALFDPRWQLCQAQIIWALYYLGSFPLGWQKPFISLGLVVVCKPALFSQVVIKKDEQDRDFPVYGKNKLWHKKSTDRLRSYPKVSCALSWAMHQLLNMFQLCIFGGQQFSYKYIQYEKNDARNMSTFRRVIALGRTYLDESSPAAISKMSKAEQQYTEKCQTMAIKSTMLLKEPITHRRGTTAAPMTAESVKGPTWMAVHTMEADRARAINLC